jgi:hypothetical protein
MVDSLTKSTSLLVHADDAFARPERAKESGKLSKARASGIKTCSMTEFKRQV